MAIWTQTESVVVARRVRLSRVVAGLWHTRRYRCVLRIETPFGLAQYRSDRYLIRRRRVRCSTAA